MHTEARGKHDFTASLLLMLDVFQSYHMFRASSSHYCPISDPFCLVLKRYSSFGESSWGLNTAWLAEGELVQQV